MNPDHKNQLVLKLLDDDLSSAEEQEVRNLLLNDPETRQIYQEHIILERLLEKNHAFSQLALNDLTEKPAPLTPIFWSSAAIIVALLALFFLIPSSPQPPAADLRFTQDSSYSIDGSNSGNRLEVGQKLTVDYGAVELKLPRDVTGIVIGPAVLKIRDEQSLLLDKGKASFQVSEKGTGFKVVTPRLEAIDLGTEFTVISSWNDQDEVHVKTGEVIVSPVLGTGQSLSAKEACSVDDNGHLQIIRQIDDSFQADLPEQIRLLEKDPFADYTIADGRISNEFMPTWDVLGNPHVVGTYNPSGHDIWHDSPILNDQSNTKGQHRLMDGPNLGFILTSSTASIQKTIDTVETGHLYSVGLTMGVRSTIKSDKHHAGYEITLLSGDSVLASEKGHSAPCAPNDFTRIHFSWDSSQLPPDVNPGDPLTLRITTQALVKGHGYFDFCNLRVSKLRQKNN